MQTETFAATDGLRLFLRSWRPAGAPRAVVVIVHGFKAHGGLYEWTGEQMVRRGLAVYALDLRGHGQSEGERLWIDRFAQFTDDVAVLVELARARHPGVPLFLLGHSAGGVISCGYVLEHQERLAGFICESFAHEIPAPDFALAVLKGLSHIAPHAHVLKLEDEGFSRDVAFVERMKTDPLIPRQGYPTNTVAEMVRADEVLKVSFEKITLPVLILHGTEDRVTRPSGSQRFHDRGGSVDKTLRLYEGHYHDLLADFGRELVLDDIVGWIEARAAAGERPREAAGSRPVV
jgi:alpha-beta hydrolase superfamily lysophospholipase